MRTTSILSSANLLEHVVARELFRIGSLSVTNHIFMVIVAGAIMLIAFPLILRRPQIVPVGVQNAVEAVCLYFRDEVAKPFLHEHTDRFLPFIWTLFFFILTCNLLGLLPVAAVVYVLSIGRIEGLGGTPTGNIYVTGALAAMTFLLVHIAGAWTQSLTQRRQGRPWLAAIVVGTAMYFYKIVPHIGGVAGIILFPLLFLMEILSLVAKSIALAIRLFVNMLAGHLVLAVVLLLVTLYKSLGMSILIAGIGVVGGVAVSCLELFVAFLQAYIFTFLATIFIGMAVNQEH